MTTSRLAYSTRDRDRDRGRDRPALSSSSTSTSTSTSTKASASASATTKARGFTLLEVVIALAILAIYLGVLLEVQVSSLNAASRSRDLSIASMLARAKMIDVEQKLFDEGFTLGDVEEEGERALIRVRDDGGGIKPELLDRIFEPLMTTKRGQGGTGLGLAISRRIIHASDGEITVRNVPGSGAEFSVTLPRLQVGRDVMPSSSDVSSLRSG